MLIFEEEHDRTHNSELPFPNEKKGCLATTVIMGKSEEIILDLLLWMAVSFCE